MAPKFPFELNPDKYLYQLWDKDTYLYLARFFRQACFDSGVLLQDGVPLHHYCRQDGWRLPAGFTSGSAAYASYFKLYDSTDIAGQPKIGVRDGSDVGRRSDCGVVKINGSIVGVAAFEELMSAAGTYFVWLHSWVTEDDTGWAHAEILTGTAADYEASRDEHTDSVGWANQLLGRFTVVDQDGTLSISAINQDYLRGGELTEIIFGDCAGGAVSEA